MNFDFVLCSVVDFIAISCAIFVMYVGIGRMALMSLKTHKKVWQAIYFLLVSAAIGYIASMAEGKLHAPIPTTLFLIATAAWFFESRNRWRNAAPDYMKNSPSEETGNKFSLGRIL